MRGSILQLFIGFEKAPESPQSGRKCFDQNWHILDSGVVWWIGIRKRGFLFRALSQDRIRKSLCAQEAFAHLIFPVCPAIRSFSEEWSPSNHRGRRSKNGYPMTNRISIGSTVPGSHQNLTPTGSIKARHGSPRKSNWTTVASWFSNSPAKGARASRLL